MSSIEQQAKEKKSGEIRYLTPLQIETSACINPMERTKYNIRRTNF